MLAALRGVAVLGPLREDGAHAFALTRDWLGAAPRALAAPSATPRWPSSRAATCRSRPGRAADLAAWSGLPLRDARAGLRRSPPS